MLVVTGHLLFGTALANALGDAGACRVVGTATVAEADADAARLAPDVVLVDADSISGAAGLVARLLVGDEHPKILAMIGPDQDALASELVRLGASGIIQSDAGLDELQDTIRGVAAGETRIPPGLLTVVLLDLRDPSGSRTHDRELLERLTKRELEVLTWMAAGEDRSGVAAELFLSVNTVRTHVRQILSKLEVHSSLEAVALLLRVQANGGTRV